MPFCWYTHMLQLIRFLVNTGYIQKSKLLTIKELRVLGNL